MHGASIVLLSIWNLFGLLSSQRGEITELKHICNNEKIIISCRVVGLNNDNLWRSLEAGEELDFCYQVELTRERKILGDETFSSIEIHKFLLYNNLTKQFIGKTKGVGAKQEEIIFSDFESAMNWLTSLKEASLPSKGKTTRTGTQHVRARVYFGWRRLLIVVPYEVFSPWKQVLVSCL